jgi:hypothetical protein
MEDPQAELITTRLSLPSDATKFDANKAMVVSKEILVKTGTVTCFNLIANQLEDGLLWDPMIVKAKPITDVRYRIGAVSQITLALDGRRLEGQALITLYKTDHTLGWILTSHPKVKEYWRLQPSKEGTIAHLTLGYEINGWFLNRIIQHLFYKRTIEKELSSTLEQLKRTAETTG